MHVREITVLSILAALGCGGTDSPSPSPSPDYLITIAGFSFLPEDLAVPPGATVIVTNQDGVPHSVTSESAPGTYAPGAVNGVEFDTGIFTKTATIAIPAGAAPGTVIPYFCRVHTSMMANQPRITIQAATH